MQDSGHGGARRGAGRPRTRTFKEILRVGQACEVEWRKTEEATFEATRDSQTTDLKFLWDAARRVPVRKRRQWYDGSEGETHRADIEMELHTLQQPPESDDSPSRITRISTQPPPGTRERIIAEIAKRFRLAETVVDNHWQAYRRFEREQLDPPDSSQT